MAHALNDMANARKSRKTQRQHEKAPRTYAGPYAWTHEIDSVDIRDVVEHEIHRDYPASHRLPSLSEQEGDFDE